jgi:hypothetical protein
MEQLKEIKQPLNLYDVFGYILPGFFFFLLFIIDVDGSKIIEYFNENTHSTTYLELEKTLKINYFKHFIFNSSEQTLGLIPLIISLIICYIIGHILSAFSSFMNKHFVKKSLNHPSHNLLNSTFQKNVCSNFCCRWFKKKSWQFYQPLDYEVQKKIIEKLNNIYGFKVSMHDSYWMIYTYICTNHPYLTRRISHFVNLSGFTRNICGTTLFYLLFKIVVLNYLFNVKFESANCSIYFMYLIVGIIIFWSYLRIHRRQAYDMFFIFLSLDLNNEKNKENEETSTQ